MESNRLEDVEAGTVHDLSEVLTEYRDPGQDAFDLCILPVLRQISKDALTEVGIHPRKVVAIRNAHARPRSKHRQALIAAAGRRASSELRSRGVKPPIDEVAACRVWLRFENAEREE